MGGPRGVGSANVFIHFLRDIPSSKSVSFSRVATALVFSDRSALELWHRLLGSVSALC